MHALCDLSPTGIPKFPLSSSHCCLPPPQRNILCGAAPLTDFFTVRCLSRTQQPWPALWPTQAPLTPATPPTTPRPPSRCRPSHRRTPGTNGAKKWIFSCLSLALRWTWEMFGDFRMSVIKTVAVSGLVIFKPDLSFHKLIATSQTLLYVLQTDSNSELVLKMALNYSEIRLKLRICQEKLSVVLKGTAFTSLKSFNAFTTKSMLNFL